VLDDGCQCLLALHASTSPSPSLSAAEDIEGTIRSQINTLYVLIDRLAMAPQTVQAMMLHLIQSFLSGAHVDMRVREALAKIPQLLPVLATTFASTQSAFKFDLLRTLVHIIATAATDRTLAVLVLRHGIAGWGWAVRTGIKDILFSRKATTPGRHLAIQTAAAMFQLCGGSWATRPDRTIATAAPASASAPAVTAVGGGGKDDVYASGNFVQMLMKIITVEVRVLLESNAIKSDTTDTLCACFSILELAIDYLIEEESSTPAKPHSISKLPSAVNTTIAAVSASSTAPTLSSFAPSTSSARLAREREEDARALLHKHQEQEREAMVAAEEASVGWNTLPASILLSVQRGFNESFAAIMVHLRDARDDGAPASPVLLACVRVLGAWLREETDALRDEFADVLPYLLRITREAPTDMDGLCYLLPGLVETVLDPFISNMCLEHQAPARVLKILLDNAAVVHATTRRRTVSGTELEATVSISELMAAVEFLRNLLVSEHVFAEAQPTFFDTSLPHLCRLLTDLEGVTDNENLFEVRGHVMSLVVFILKDMDPSRASPDVVRLVGSPTAPLWALIIAYLASHSLLDLRSLYTLCLEGLVGCLAWNPERIATAFVEYQFVASLLDVLCRPLEAHRVTGVQDDEAALEPEENVENFLLRCLPFLEATILSEMRAYFDTKPPGVKAEAQQRCPELISRF
jgi:hypothetical protein